VLETAAKTKASTPSSYDMLPRMADYKCASIGCYSYQSPEKNQQLQRLQTAINQFAQAAAFQPLKVDGIIGKGTTEAALIVLGYLAELDKGVVGSAAAGLEAQINTPEQLTVGAQAVLDLLTLALKQPPAQIASQITQPAPLPAPTPSPSTVQLATTTANKPPTTSSPTTAARLNQLQITRPALSTSLVDRIPPWAAYVSGAALALGALAAVIGLSKKRKAAGASPVVAGRWYT
jgi:hypothetical protein